MAQHDMNIANQGFPAFRSDLNSALSAIVSNSSGATAPTTTFAYQWWADTANDLLKQRNAANDGWVSILTLSTGEPVSGGIQDKIQEGNSSVEVVDTGTGYVAVVVDGVETARLDASGNLKFNSGYGSVATAYGCRAWVSFNGTGTVAINGSGNISSITDNATGQYTLNFTTALADTNYSVVTANDNGEYVTFIDSASVATGSVQLRVYYADANAYTDTPLVTAAIFR